MEKKAKETPGRPRSLHASMSVDPLLTGYGIKRLEGRERSPILSFVQAGMGREV